MIDVPPAVQAKALVHEAGAWLDDLPSLVASLEREWSLTVGRVYPDATEALVVEAVCGDGTAAVLKLVVPRGDSAARASNRYARDEITVLRLASGQGCAQLLRSDSERGALLLERLGPSLHDLGLPLPRQHEILCAAAARVWRPAPDSGLPTGAEKGRWLAEFITATWEELGQPCAPRAVAHALSCVERRVAAHNDQRAMLLHGDVHAWNALAADDGEFKLVDPDGLLAEPEYDLGIIMREDPVELMAGDPYRRAAWLADRTGLDPRAIWDWGVAERVSTGLLATRIELQPVGREMLAAADAIARAESVV
ncbi:MAG TPA: aminoglycoside phosphotransferase family protein [Micromonosporaceae bacterium]|jgi:streptomycin 6-kinase